MYQKPQFQQFLVRQTFFLKEKGEITKAAPTDERLRTVKDTASVQPLMVAPTSRNTVFLTLKCKTFLKYNVVPIHLVWHVN